MGDMFGDDEIWRTGIYLGAGLGIALFLLGGFVSRVAGTWRQADGLVVILRQLGPWVWGESTPPGGRQAYRGRVVFGRLRLSRRDTGDGHLQALGFSPGQAAQVSGRQTGTLVMRQVNRDLMVGDFVGFAFSFDGDKVQGSRPAKPVPRRLTRIG